MDSVTFEENKKQIEDAINIRIKNGSIKDPLGFILLDGFFNMTYNKKIDNSIIVGGPSVPCVSVVGKSTGLIYTFALKVLLPNIQI
jgi:hypothetical protein